VANLTSGWPKFRAGNSLQAGDEVKFEYEPASGGKLPAIRITLVSRGNANKQAEKMQAALASKRRASAADGGAEGRRRWACRRA
jgi:hypothetical protein